MIYEIKFAHGESNIFAETSASFDVQSSVILRSEKGPFYGKVLRKLTETNGIVPNFEILREASAEDLEKISALKKYSRAAKKRVRELVEVQNLEMKIVDVAYSFDQQQLFISFTAENRVDFRLLLRELAVAFRTRIELRQIGPRDAAKVSGGIGPCGRPLCCSEFVYEFPNVSIKMAKNQNLSLKQSKLNGLCGRLMCCLTYEDQFYSEAQKRFPDFGETVNTVEGQGRVIGLNVLNNRVKIRCGEYSKEFELAEIEVKHGG